MKEIYKLMRSAGISRSYRGYQYFAAAVKMISEDETKLSNIRKEVYLPIAIRYKENIQNVERDIRTIRDVIVRDNKPFLKELAPGEPYNIKAPYPREIIEAFAEYVLSNGPLKKARE